MIQTGNIAKDRVLMLAIVVVIAFVLYKFLNSDLFKGLGKGAQGVGDAVSGVGSAIGATGAGVAKVVTSYADMVEGGLHTFSYYTGIITDPALKPYLDTYANLPFYNIPNLNGKPFAGMTDLSKTHWVGSYPEKTYIALAKKINDAHGKFNDDEQAIYGVIGSLPSWYHFMKLSAMFNRITGKNMQSFFDDILNEKERAQIGKMMYQKPLISWVKK